MLLTGLQNFLLTDEYYLFVFSYIKQLENISNYMNLSISFCVFNTRPCFNPIL